VKESVRETEFNDARPTDWVAVVHPGM
jgi:hypothetical protein